MWVRSLVIGKSRDLADQSLFHKVSLIAVLAWVGLGADGLSSSCYGPEETFKALGAHVALAPFIAIASMATIAIICISYSQIIALFPGGGGGYLVASKLLSPKLGLISGCALLVDYVLTISISIASGADALFSLFPSTWLPWKILFAAVGVAFLTLLNLRGVKESVLLLVPVFFLFIITYGFGIGYGVATHLGTLPEIVHRTGADLRSTHAQLGSLGLFFICVRAFSVGAGTYTGIEAVSNGLPILREPRVKTGRRTMLYMGISLALTVGGLLLAYLLYQVSPEEGKTLNAVLFEKMSAAWSPLFARTFLWSAMISGAALLLIAAQAGFLDGPRVLANMALDRWFPARFSMLSDRFVAQNGIVLMGTAALVVLLVTRGSVGLLMVLYSINVFITFSLSQLGMVRHWWSHRATAPAWRKKLLINAIGFSVTTFILIMLTATKFSEGGWVTLLITAAFVLLALLTRRHYQVTRQRLERLDEILPTAAQDLSALPNHGLECVNRSAAQEQTAVIFVNGFNGLGMHTVLNIARMFPGMFRKFFFVQIGLVDAGVFKGSAELDKLREHVRVEASRYADYMRKNGLAAEAITEISYDVVQTASEVADGIVERFPNAIFFGGQLVFKQESRLMHLLHNFTVFALQRKFFRQGLPFVVVPIRV